MHSVIKMRRYILTFAIITMIATITSCALIDLNENKQRAQTRTRTHQTLSLPKSNPQPTPQPIPLSQHNWLTHTVAPGENLSTIFAKYGLSKKTLYQIVSTSEFSKEISGLHPGKIFKISINDSGDLDTLRYYPNKLVTLEIKQTAEGLESTKSVKKVEKQIVNARVKINSSLFSDAKATGLSDKLVMEIAQIFAWDIDFALDLQRGDEFTVIYEQLFLDGEKIGTGSILATEFINRGRPHIAVRYEDSNGDANYFTPDGKSLKKSFLRTPVQFARISSRFNLQRRHPVLNKIRAHKGVDYAAPTGTPIRATGNGKIVFKGRKGGYGRVVIVQHGKIYSTLYAHLSRFNNNIGKGAKVTQGQTLGYVGKSGLATGPHLHYEFRVNGRHKNPLTVKLPKSIPINKENLISFKTSTNPILSQLAALKSNMLAKIESTTTNETEHF